MPDARNLPAPPARLDDCLALWREPGPAYRGKPFWSWNGRLEIPELKRQVRVLKDMGMGGFFMHSRTGLATEYLGREWFQAINATADEGGRLGMEAWIYDEDRWPSGSAGGLATEDEAFRMRLLRCRVVRGGGVERPPRERFLAAFAADLDGFDLGPYEEIGYEEAGAVPEGRTLLLFSWELMPCDSFYNGNTYLDTLNRKAVEHFLAITHDRYAEACGDRLGRSIPGIFTDEPHRGFVMLGDVWSAGAEDSAHTAPWSESVPEAFERAFGEPLLPVLPEVFFFKNGVRVSHRKWQYMEILQRLFLENWAGPCLERSHRHGLALTGHVLHEDSLGAQACAGGSVQRYYEHMDVPGIDLLGGANPSYWVARQVQSVARQAGKPWILSELYGCTGWQTDFSDHKRIGDWQALFGINLRCHHLSWYSMAGEAKRDYPASIFFQSPWWRDYGAVETYFARLGVVLQSGRPVCDVLVVNPVESVWAQIHPGWAKWLESKDPELLELDRRYRELFHWLAGGQVDFDYGDEDHLARLAEVDEGEDGAPALRLGEMRYRTVVVGGCATLRGSTVELLSKFAERGGRVVFAGDPPEYVDAEASPAASALAGRTVRTEFSREGVLAAIPARALSRRLRVDAEGGPVFAQVRELDTGWFAVLLNVSEEPVQGPVRVRFDAGAAVEEWDALGGGRRAVEAAKTPDGLAWDTSFPGLKERVFFIHRNEKPDTEAAGDLPPEELELDSAAGREIEGPFAYELGEPNVLVLDRAELAIEGEDPLPAMEVLQAEAVLAERVGAPLRTGTMVQPWAREKEPDEGAPALRAELVFRFEVDVLPEGPVSLLIEQPETFSIVLNDVALKARGEADAWRIDPCLREIELPAGVLRSGSNTVKLGFAYRAGFDIEAVYLRGAFGVRVEGLTPRLGSLPDRLAAGDATAQGLFCYSDRIVYEIPVDRPGVLEIEPLGTACVAFHGSAGRRLRPWAPFRHRVTVAEAEAGAVRCELVLTRRNTFGPLHHTDRGLNFVGPDSFRSKGADWTDGYVVLPAGLKAARFHPVA